MGLLDVLQKEVGFAKLLGQVLMVDESRLKHSEKKKKRIAGSIQSVLARGEPSGDIVRTLREEQRKAGAPIKGTKRTEGLGRNYFKHTDRSDLEMVGVHVPNARDAGITDMLQPRCILRQSSHV